MSRKNIKNHTFKPLAARPRFTNIVCSCIKNTFSTCSQHA